jgi:hypothetical protein
MGSAELHSTISKAREYLNPFLDHELLIFDDVIQRGTTGILVQQADRRSDPELGITSRSKYQ